MEIATLLLLAGAAAALKATYLLPSTGQEITLETINRAPLAGGSQALTELQITEHVVSLRRGTAKSTSSEYVQAITQQGVSRLANGSTSFISVESGSVFLAGVTVGGQQFDVVIDTGSSDPWLVSPDFVCADPSDGSPLPQASCQFGPTYNPASSPSYQAMADENFNITYSDQEELNGDMAYERFEMAGITVPQQEFGLVNYAMWTGDGTSSGLVGFAYGTLTSAYAGTNPTHDQKGSTLLYNPLFVNMYNLSLIAPVFTLAISRGSDGGVLALGGIPDIPHSPFWASVPIQSVGVFTGTTTPAYEFYTVISDGFAYSSDQSTQFNPHSTLNPLKTNLVGNGTTVIIDSGTSIIYAPDDVADGVAGAFNPPANYDGNYGFWQVECDAIPPLFGVSIGKKIFYVNAADMIEQISDTECISGVQRNNGGLTILGDVWMKNVLCVFDIGAEMMRFAAREFYGLTSTPVSPNG